MRQVTPDMTEQMRECIAACQSCHDVCLETITYCLSRGGPHAAAQHITMLLDCAEACRFSADAMLRRSAIHGRACAFCAEACERCAESCEQFGEDAAMRRCAEVCRECAESCRETARAHTEMAA